jgi:hypothetical protein
MMNKKVYLALAVMVLAALACSIDINTNPTTQTPTVGGESTQTTSIGISNNLPYYDDFSNSNSGWDIYSTDTGSAGYQGGYYFVISKSNQSSSYSVSSRFFSDIVINVDATPVSGPTDKSFANFIYEIDCRTQKNGDGYLFNLSTDGYFAAGYYANGKYISMLSGDKWAPSNAIHPGMATNHIAVTCAGSQLKLEINSQVVFDEKDTTFTQGDIGLGVGTHDSKSTPAEVHFDNLAVTAPYTPEPQTAGGNSNSQHILFQDDFSNPDSGLNNGDIVELGSYGYKSGYYFLITTKKPYALFAEYKMVFSDTVIDVDATPVSGPDNDNFGYGVKCLGQKNFASLFFMIKPDGYYYVGYFPGDGKKSISLLENGEWQPSNAIHQGMATNHITITCSGNQFRMEVNGQLLYEGQYSTYTEGIIGLGVANLGENIPPEVHFDNLVVTTP